MVDREPQPGGEELHTFSGVAEESGVAANPGSTYGILSAMFGPTTAEQIFESDEEAVIRAQNILDKIVHEANHGIIVTGVHPGLELFDEVECRDTRSHTTGTERLPIVGLVGRITWRLNLDSHFGVVAYEQELRLGGLQRYSWSRYGNQVFASEGSGIDLPYAPSDPENRLVTTPVIPPPEYADAGFQPADVSISPIPEYAQTQTRPHLPPLREALFNPPEPYPSRLIIGPDNLQELQNRENQLEYLRAGVADPRQSQQAHDEYIRALLRANTVVIPGLDTDAENPLFNPNRPSRPRPQRQSPGDFRNRRFR